MVARLRLGSLTTSSSSRCRRVVTHSPAFDEDARAANTRAVEELGRDTLKPMGLVRTMLE